MTISSKLMNAILSTLLLRICFVLFVFATLGFVSAVYMSVYADQARHSVHAPAKLYTGLPLPEKIQLDGQEYTKGYLVTTFIEAAFNPHIRRRTYIPPLFALRKDRDDPMTFKEGYKIQYPWLYEFLYRDKGLPTFLSLKKWTHPPRVSTGFPNDLKPFKTYIGPDGKEIESGFFPNGADDIPNEIIDEIKSGAAFISHATGMEVSYIPHEEETTDNYAEMRIVFTNFVSNWDTPFKWGKEGVVVITSGGGQDHRNFRQRTEEYLYPVYYTPYSQTQVDGYLLPHADDSIGMSFCFIWQGHALDMIRSLIRECMVRSMGLTQNIKGTPVNSILSYWNNPQLFGLKKGPDLPRPLDEVDSFLLGMLYDPALKPGMTPLETFNLLRPQEEN